MTLTMGSPSSPFNSIYDPSKPNKYLHGVECVWTFITDDPAYGVHLQFNRIDITSSPGCNGPPLDYLQIFNEPNLPSDYMNQP